MTDLWWDWDHRAELYNVNVPLGFRDEKGQRIEPEVIQTTVDRASYSSLYSKSPVFPVFCHARHGYDWRVCLGKHKGFIVTYCSLCFLSYLTNAHSRPLGLLVTAKVSLSSSARTKC